MCDIQITTKNIEEFRADLKIRDGDLPFEMWDVFDRDNFEESESFGPESWQVASALINLSVLFRKQNRLSEAEPVNERALGVYGSALGADHPHTANTGVNLALLKFDLDKFEEAAELCDRFLEAHRANLEQSGEMAANQLRKLADCFHQLALRLSGHRWKKCASYRGSTVEEGRGPETKRAQQYSA